MIIPKKNLVLQNKLIFYLSYLKLRIHKYLLLGLNEHLINYTLFVFLHFFYKVTCYFDIKLNVSLKSLK